MCISWTDKELNIINMHGASTKLTLMLVERGTSILFV